MKRKALELLALAESELRFDALTYFLETLACGWVCHWMSQGDIKNQEAEGHLLLSWGRS